MAEIIKVYKEHLPSLRFIGKCYTNADRDGGWNGFKTAGLKSLKSWAKT